MTIKFVKEIEPNGDEWYKVLINDWPDLTTRNEADAKQHYLTLIKNGGKITHVIEQTIIE